MLLARARRLDSPRGFFGPARGAALHCHGAHDAEARHGAGAASAPHGRLARGCARPARATGWWGDVSPRRAATPPLPDRLTAHFASLLLPTGQGRGDGGWQRATVPAGLAVAASGARPATDLVCQTCHWQTCQWCHTVGDVTGPVRTVRARYPRGDSGGTARCSDARGGLGIRPSPRLNGPAGPCGGFRPQPRLGRSGSAGHSGYRDRECSVITDH